MTQGIREYLKRHTCYDVLPVSFKQSILDIDLPIKKALLLLLQNGITCAPVWDHRQSRVVACLSAVDFVKLILGYYDSHMPLDEALKEIEGGRTIRSLYDGGMLFLSDDMVKSVMAGSDDSLLDSARLLVDSRVDNLLVMTAPDDLLTLMDHNRIVKFLAVNYPAVAGDSAHLEKCISEVEGLAKFEGIITVSPSTSVVNVLKCFIEYSISAVPVVDDEGSLLDVCDVVDFINLLPSGVYMDLEMPVSDMLMKRSSASSLQLTIPTCSKHTQIKSLLDTIRSPAQHCIPRFYVLESPPENRRLLGVLSSHDLLKYLI